MAKTLAERWSETFEIATKRCRRAVDAVFQERQQCLQDRRFAFVTGAQWEGPLNTLYQSKARFEVNKIAGAISDLMSEYAKNRISVDYRPLRGKDDDGLSEVLDGLYRSDERDSNAQAAYDNAYFEGITGGFGAWRLKAEYEDEEDPDNEAQRIRMLPIYDADSCVYFDPASQTEDKADPMFAFVLHPMPYQDFVDSYPDHAPATWPKTVDQSCFDWAPSPNLIYLAEYYEVTYKNEKYRTYRTLVGEEVRVEADDEEQIQFLEATGGVMIRERRIKRRKVRKYLMSGGGVIEECGEVAGGVIPIVPFFAKRFVIDGAERCMGVVRNAKDAQRLRNMQVSRIAEVAAMSPYAKPIFLAEQVEGLGYEWANDHIANYPYLRVKPITGNNGEKIPQGPLGYTQPPEIPPAVVGMAQASDADLDAVLGNREAGQELKSNVSAQAVELVQASTDVGSSGFMDQFAKAMRRCGELWLAMAREVYVEEGREMRVVGERGDESAVVLSEPQYDPVKAREYLANNVRDARMQVLVDVGPMFQSRRDATVRAIVGMMQSIGQADPEMTQILAATALVNMDGEGIKDLQDYFRQSLVRRGVVKPSEEEMAAMEAEAANQQPDAQQQALLAYAEREQADAAEARANTLRTIQDASLKEAQTAKTQAETVKTLMEAGQ